MLHEPPELALERLSIRDFRGIESLDLNFCGPDGMVNRLVVIGGPNGCGKTSVLEAAILLLDDNHTIPDIARRDNTRQGAAEHFTVEGQIRDSFAPTCQLTRRLSASGYDPKQTDGSIPLWYFSSTRSPGLRGPVNVTAGDERSAHKTSSKRLMTVKQRLVNAAAVEKFSQSGPPDANEYSLLIGLINRAWREFDSTSNASIQVELTDSFRRERGSFDLFYNRPGQPRLELDHLSSGQLELFLFIAELAFHRDRIGFIFIDEPELHLDPQWHRPFLRSLMRIQRKAQFIVTTHSPEIYDSAYSYERHFLIPDDDPRARLWVKPHHDPVEA